MKILQRGKITYYIRDESVVVGFNNFQWISYNVYSLQNRKPFYSFRRELLNSRPDEFATLVDQIKLGQKHGLKAVASSKPVEARD